MHQLAALTQVGHRMQYIGRRLWQPKLLPSDLQRNTSQLHGHVPVTTNLPVRCLQMPEH
jgi:hypothetical protein